MAQAGLGLSLQLFPYQIEGVDAVIGELRQEKCAGDASEPGGSSGRLPSHLEELERRCHSYLPAERIGIGHRGQKGLVGDEELDLDHLFQDGGPTYQTEISTDLAVVVGSGMGRLSSFRPSR